VFRLAVITGRAKADPTTALRGVIAAPKHKGRPAITDEKAFGAFLRSLDEFTGWPILKAAIKFQILSMVRPGEARGAKRAEFNLDKAVWSIPPERMKMRRPHIVPLSTQAVSVVENIWPYSDNFELVFPSIQSKKKLLSENAFNAAIRRMGYSGEEVTAHGFRVTASSILNARGYNPDVIEAALTHQDLNTIRRTYNRATYWDERVTLMQDRADLLERLPE
jgi:integrase